MSGAVHTTMQACRRAQEVGGRLWAHLCEQLAACSQLRKVERRCRSDSDAVAAARAEACTPFPGAGAA